MNGRGHMKRKSKKGRKSIQENTCTYCIEILDWELQYHFSLNPNKDIIVGPYWEQMNLKMTGKLLEPKKLQGRLIQIDILGDREKVSVLENPEKYHFEPRAVGILTAKKGHTEFSGFIPPDILPLIYFMLESGKTKILVLTGQSLYYGSADITSIYFEKDYNPRDWM
jgi:hypothetical protein